MPAENFPEDADDLEHAAVSPASVLDDSKVGVLDARAPGGDDEVVRHADEREARG